MKDENRLITIICAVFALVGLIVVAVGAAITASDQNFRRTAVETAAVITDIFRSRDRDGDTTHTVYVRFYVNDKEYEGQLGAWSSGMAEGQSVRIFYDPDNPQRFRSGSGFGINVFLFLFGGVFFLVGFIPMYKMQKRKLSKKGLLRDGQRVMAAFSDVVQGNVTLNGRTSFKLVCKYADSAGKNSHRFESGNIWENPLSYRDRQAMPAVPVYVNCDDYSKYYVDVDAFLTGIKQ